MRKPLRFFSSVIEHGFSLKENKATISGELLAGLTTFLSMAYIIALNPLLLSRTGMDFGAVMFATVIAAAAGTLVVSLLSNYPFAIAPGMGLNAYFTYGIVMQEGFSWEQALGACFLVGCLLYLLNVLGIRKQIINEVPKNLRLATIGGIGLFLAFIGLKEIGLLVHHPTLFLSVGDIRDPHILLFLFGILLISILQSRGNRFSFLIAIVVNWVIGLCFGLTEWRGIFSLPPDPSSTFFALHFSAMTSPNFYIVILSLVFAGVFYATGTMMSLGKQGAYLDKDEQLPRVKKALFGDTFATIVGSLLGTSPSTTYLESSAGLAVGGRTGLTTLTVSMLFLVSLFFTPLILSIPLFATTPILILIGVLLTKEVRGMEWHDPSEWTPAFLILVGIPFTLSIAYGMALGFVSYPLIKLFSGKKEDVSLLCWALAVVFAIRLFF